MVALQLGMTNVLLPTECPRNTRSVPGMGVSVHHCAHTVRHVPTSADSAAEFKVVHHQLDMIIGQAYQRVGLGSLPKTKPNLQHSWSLHARLIKSDRMKMIDVFSDISRRWTLSDAQNQLQPIHHQAARRSDHRCHNLIKAPLPDP